MTQTLDQLSAAATELSPCPFCGREPHIIERVTGPNGPGFFCAVSCYCGGYSAKAHQSATSNNDQMARVEAITRWNTRTGQLIAVSDDAIERVAQLTQENDDLKAADRDHLSATRGMETRLSADITRLQAERDALLIALHDAIRRPMGVVPASADPFYSPAMADQAEVRRIEKDAQP